ncbi:MAG TPA: hypothetical protein GX530_03115 [Corynebacteriales bacterium]|nr:hypothetical protein [Mycobacteriales bacterium]
MKREEVMAILKDQFDNDDVAVVIPQAVVNELNDEGKEFLAGIGFVDTEIGMVSGGGVDDQPE